eukprot:1151093-Amphidinium_carterae.1
MGVNTGSHTFLTSSSNSSRTSDSACLLSSLVIDSASLSVTGRGVVPLTILVPTKISQVRSVMGLTTNNRPTSPLVANAFCFFWSSNLLTEKYSPNAGLVQAFDIWHCGTCVAYSKACDHHGTIEKLQQLVRTFVFTFKLRRSELRVSDSVQPPQQLYL